MRKSTCRLIMQLHQTELLSNPSTRLQFNFHDFQVNKTLTVFYFPYILFLGFSHFA